jgi:hemin uptake protein HemP
MPDKLPTGGLGAPPDPLTAAVARPIADSPGGGLRPGEHPSGEHPRAAEQGTGTLEFGGPAAIGLPVSPVIRELEFAALSGGANEVWIRWEDQLYRLRRTRNGKLLLTK